MGSLGQRHLKQQEIERIMKLHREGLNFATISQRINCTARTVSRVVKREQDKVEENA